MPSVVFEGSNASVRVSYTETYNASANESTIKLTDVEMKASVWFGSVAIHGRVKVNGTTLCSIGPGVSISNEINLDTSYSSISNLSLGSTTVAHGADGSGSFTMTLDEAEDASATYNQGWFGTYYQYRDHVGVRTPAPETVTLTTRPRISSVTATNAYFGDSENPVTITISRYNSAFTHTIKTKCAGRTQTLMTKGTTYPTLTWTPAVATYAPLIPNAMSATATITCETYNGSTLVGTSSTTCKLTLKAANVAPSVTIATEDPTGLLSTYGRYIKGKSKVKVTLTNTFKYGATLATTQIKANGATYNASPATTDFIQSTSVTSVTAKIVDSRGQSASASATIAIYAYNAPQINSYSVYRCRSDGTEDNTGAYFAVAYNTTVTSLGSQNSKTLTVKYKKQSASSYSSKAITLSTYNASGVFDPIAADINSTYNVRLELKDDFSTTIVTLNLPTAATRMNWGAGVDGGVAIGKVNEYDKTFEVASDWDVKFGKPLPITSGGTGGASQTAAALNLGAIDLYVGTEIPENADLNDYTTPGVYYCPSAAIAGTLTNAPASNAFKLIVGRTVLSTRFFQIAILNVSGPVIWKRYYNGSWSAWVRSFAEGADAAAARSQLGAAAAPTVVIKNGTLTGSTYASSVEYTVSGTGTVIVYAGIYSDTTEDFGTWQAEIYYDGTLIMGEGSRLTEGRNERFGASTSVPIAVTNGKKIKITVYCSKGGTRNIYRRFLCFGCTVS